MPSPTDTQLLQRAIPDAAQNRLAFAQTCKDDCEAADDAMNLRARILALKGRPFDDLSGDESETARQTFVYAELHQRALMETFNNVAGMDAYRKANSCATLYRRRRISLWGLSRIDTKQMEPA